ncbi:MAG: histidine kinase dimerization/phosphoacceptor domain -containing protein [Promethearchaeota archaeon]
MNANYSIQNLNKKYEILFISDSEEIKFIIIRKLKKHNFEVQFESIKDNHNISLVLSKKKWDIILSDYNAWMLYGLKILKNIKENELIIPYIVIGKKIDEKTMISLIEKGISDYIQKDDLDRLVPTIKHEIKNKELFIKLKQTQQYIEDRIHRQALIAKFGLEAITEKNIDKLFEKATNLLAKILDVEYIKILELLPDKRFLKLRAGVGWNKGLVGNATVENNKYSQAGYTLLKTKPVIVENLHNESRFIAPKLLVDHNVVSGMSVIIQGKNSPFGILGAHTKKFRKFSDDDINFLQSIANILTNVILRDITEKDLRESEEKYRTLTEQSLLGTLIIANERIIFVNKSISNIFGYSIEELLSWTLKTLMQHIHPKDLEKTIKKCKDVLEDKIISFQSDIRIRQKNKNYLYIRQYVKKINFQGKPALHINIINITEQKKNELLLESSLEEKEILLKEIHHRVKNNLQVISSLIVLEEQNIKDEKVINIFKDLQSHIKAMALIHEALYKSENLNKIDISKYIKDLVDNLFKAYSENSKNVKFYLNIDNIDFNLDRAIYCGFIINELVSNSLKYAFSKNEGGKIIISLNKTMDNRVLLDVYDNGKGFPKDIDCNNLNTIGLNLVSTITKQMNGTIQIKKNNGTHIMITWKL